MRITNIDVERFGTLSNLNLTGFGNGLNVVYGPNGSGKTTLMQFTRSILYGFPRTGDSKHLPSVHPGRQGGTIGLESGSRTLSISRFSDNGSAGQLTIQAKDGSAQAANELKAILADVSQMTFNSLFTVGYREAESIDELIDDLIASRPENMTDVPELIPVRNALAEVDRSRTELHNGGQAHAEIRRLGIERDRILGDINRLKSGDDTLPRRLREVQTEISQLEERRDQLLKRISELEVAIAQREQSPVESDHELPAVPANSECLVHELVALEEQIRKWSLWRREIAEQIAATQQAIDGLQLQETEWSAHNPIAQLADMRTRLRATEQQVRSLQQVVSPLNGQHRASRTNGEHPSHMMRALQGSVYDLCRELTRHERIDRRQSLTEEVGQLGRCRNEASRQLELLTRRRELLLRDFGIADESGLEIRRHRLAQLCRCSEHRSWLEGQHNVPSQVIIPQGPDLELERLQSELKQARFEVAAVQSELETLRQRRHAIELQLRQAPDARRAAELQMELNLVEQKLRNSTQRFQVLSATRSILEELRDAYEARRQPRTLADASDYLRRLTNGTHVRILADRDQRRLLAEQADGATVPVDALSRGTRDQVSLSLRLALADAYTRRGAQLPLILDDVFVSADTGHARATAELLRDFGAKGHQILFFTCHEHIAQLFRLLDVPVRTLAGQREIAATPKPAPKPIPKPAPVIAPLVSTIRPLVATRAEPLPVINSLSLKAFSGLTPEPPKQQANPVIRPEVQRVAAPPTPVVHVEESPQTTAGNWIFYMEMSSPVSELSSISPEEAEELESIGAVTVEDLLALVPDASALRLSHMGVSPARIQSWQAQAMMACRIPMLRRRDAELLVCCGYTTPEQLAETEPEELFDVVRRYQQSNDGRRFVRPENPFDLQQAINWVRWSRHARTLWESREGRRRGRAVPSHPSRPAVARRRVVSRTATPSRRRANRKASESATQKRRRPATDRSTSTRQGIISSTESNRSGSAKTSGNRTGGNRTDGNELRFYLERTSPVEAAPSIGPKTASRLEKIGVITVNDLLNANPIEVAQQLRQRRFNADLIRNWQSQAELVCRIPQLRGHDAQILVACNITDPDEISAMRPADLFAIVQPFVTTTEGIRIIRNGKEPDLQEVTDWINWARQARSLRAA